jgi:DNA-binding Lrp family transcriptional regulator
MRDWTRDRFMWGRCIRQAAEISPSAKMLAWALSEQFADNETGECWPKVGTLAEALALSERQVRRAVRELEDGGWLLVERASGRGRASSYRLAFPGEMAARKGDKVVTLRSRERVTRLTAKGDMAVTPYREPTRNPPPRARKELPSRSETPRRGPAIPEVFETSSKRIAAWSEWLACRGYPSLAAMRLGDRRGHVRGFLVPFRWPPRLGDDTDVATAEAFFAMKGGGMPDAPPCPAMAGAAAC